jgi:23S rRNA pseudouridine1911/1915/1917 synthase
MKPRRLKFTVQGPAASERADKVLAHFLKDTSRARVQEAFAQKKVWRGETPIAKSQRVAPGDVLHIELPAPPPSEVEAVAGDLTVIYEDDDLLVLNKSSGLIMHPGGGTGADTLVHFALHHTGGKLSQLGGARRPGIVHRLDKETSGAVVLAKSDRAYLALTKLFSERDVAKEYVALVERVPKLRSGSIREPIGRNPVVRVKMAVVPGTRGKPAHTDWSVEESFGKSAALVRCWLHTGRTHQIRVHLAHLNHPLLGDYTYGWRPRGGVAGSAGRVMLHAAVLAFPHPADGRPLEFRVPPPEDFLALAAELREEARRDAKTQVVKRMDHAAHVREVH